MLTHFTNLLKNKQIEQAINEYVNSHLTIYYNKKERTIKKGIWLKYLKNNLLSPYTEIIQFNVSEIESINAMSSKFKINMICKNIKGNLFFKEVHVKKSITNNLIHNLNFNISSH